MEPDAAVSPVHAQIIHLLHGHLGSRGGTPARESIPGRADNLRHQEKEYGKDATLNEIPPPPAALGASPSCSPASVSASSTYPAHELGKYAAHSSAAASTLSPPRPSTQPLATSPWLHGMVSHAGNEARIKGGACLQRLGGADIFVTEKGEERVQALLRMSRASGVGLKNALSRLEIEREAGRRQLEASRSRERKLRQDLARRDELVDSGERQLQELQHALIRAQAERDQVARGSLHVHEQIACAHDLAAETARVELAEALRRRRTRTKAFQAWVEKAHASVLLLLSSRLAIQSASLHAFRRWRRHTPVSISKMLSRVPESSRLHAKRAVPFGHEGQLLKGWKKWREWTLARTNRDVSASRLRLHRSRRAIRYRFRCWRGVHRMREDSVAGRKEALRIVLRATALTDLTDAVLMWRLATAAWLAEAQVTPKLRSSAERQLDDLRASSIAALRRSEAEARGLRAELSEEQRRLIDALESQKQVINASEQTEKMLHAQKSALVTTIADADSLVSTLSEACQAASRAAQREQRKASAELHASVGQALADGRSAVEAERTKTLVAHAEVKAVVMALHEADVTTAEWQRATAQRAHEEISKREERLLELSQQLEEARAVAVERQAAMQQLKESDAERLRAAEDARAREAEVLHAELAAQRTTLLAQLSELEEESCAARGVLGARQKEVEALQQSLSQQVMATDTLKSDFTTRLESAQVALRDAIEEASRREARQAEAAAMLRRQAEQAKREMEASLKQAAVERALAVEANLADFEAAFHVGLGLPPPDEEARTARTDPVPQGRAAQVLALVSRREASLRQHASSLNDEHTARETAMASELERARNAAAAEAAENSRAMAAAAQELQQSEAARAKAEEGREEAESLTRMAVATCKASDTAREAAEEARRIAETAHATIQASLHECEQEIAQAESAHAIAVVDTAIQLEQMKVVIEEVELELEEVREERLRVRQLWTRAEEALRAAEAGRAEAEVAVARVMEAHAAGMAEARRLHTEKQEVEVALKSALAQQIDIQASHEEAHAEKMSSLEAELLQASEREVKLQAAGSAMQSALRAASARETELHATILELRQSISRQQEELEVCRRDAEASETQKLCDLRASHEAAIAAMKAAAAARASEQKEVKASLEARLETLSGEHQLAEARLVENTQASLDLVEQLKSATASCRDEATRRKSLEAQLLQASADLEVARARAALLESAVDSAEALAADVGRRAARAEGSAAALETQVVAQEMVYAAVTSSVQIAVQDHVVATDVVRRTVQVEIAAQDEIRAALEKQLTEKDNAIQEMRVQLEENERKAESRVTLLKSSLDELRAARALLEGKLAEQREARGALEAQLQAKDNAVQVLSAKLSQEESAESRSAALNEQLEELRAAQVLLEGQLTEQRQARGELEIQLEAKENAVQVLRTELSKEDVTTGRMASLKATLEELRTARTLLEGELANQLQARASLEAQLVEKESAIQVLSIQVEESERNAGGRVATLRATLEELRASQALLEGRLTEQRTARGALEVQLQEKERAIQDLGIQLKEKEQSAESRVTSLKATLQEFRAAQALFDGQLAEQRKARGALEAQLEEKENAVQILRATLRQEESAEGKVVSLEETLRELREAKALLEGKLTEQLEARSSLEAKLEEKENIVASLRANSLEQLDSAERKVSLMKKALQDHQIAQASLAQNLAEANTSRGALETRLQEEVSARTTCEVKIQDLSKECLILRARSNELVQILNAVKSECKKAEDAVVERVAVVERHAAEREAAHTRTLNQATETLVACLRDEILKLETKVAMSESARLSATEQAATAASEALAHMQAAQSAKTSREAAAVAQTTAEAALLSAQRELELLSARAKNAEHARDEALRAAQMAASGREEAEQRASAESQRVQTALQRCEAVESASKHEEKLLKQELATARADLAERINAIDRKWAGQKVLLETRVEELLNERDGLTAELDAVRRAASELNATSYAVEAELRTAREVAEVKVQHAQRTTAMEIAAGQRKEHLLREEIAILESELEASRAATTSATIDAASREAALRSAATMDLAQAISTVEIREAETRATLEQTWVAERRKLARRATELLAERDSLQAKVQQLSIKESEAAAEREAERETFHAEFTEYADREQQMRETIKKMSDSMRERELQAQKAVATAVKTVRESFLRDQEMVLAKAEAHVQVERAVGKELVAAKSAEIEASVLLGHLQRRLRRRARLWLRWTARLCQSCHAGDVARRRRAFQRLRLGSLHMHAERSRQRLVSKSELVRLSVISKTFLHFWRDAALRSVCACRHLSAATAFNERQVTKSALSSWRGLHCKYVSFRACERAVVSTSHQRKLRKAYEVWQNETQRRAALTLALNGLGLQHRESKTAFVKWRLATSLREGENKLFQISSQSLLQKAMRRWLFRLLPRASLRARARRGVMLLRLLDAIGRWVSRASVLALRSSHDSLLRTVAVHRLRTCVRRWSTQAKPSRRAVTHSAARFRASRATESILMLSAEASVRRRRCNACQLDRTRKLRSAWQRHCVATVERKHYSEQWESAIAAAGQHALQAAFRRLKRTKSMANETAYSTAVRRVQARQLERACKLWRVNCAFRTARTQSPAHAARSYLKAWRRNAKLSKHVTIHRHRSQMLASRAFDDRRARRCLAELVLSSSLAKRSEFGRMHTFANAKRRLFLTWSNNRHLLVLRDLEMMQASTRARNRALRTGMCTWCANRLIALKVDKNRNAYLAARWRQWTCASAFHRVSMKAARELRRRSNFCELRFGFLRLVRACAERAAFWELATFSAAHARGKVFRKLGANTIEVRALQIEERARFTAAARAWRLSSFKRWRRSHTTHAVWQGAATRAASTAPRLTTRRALQTWRLETAAIAITNEFWRTHLLTSAWRSWAAAPKAFIARGSRWPARRTTRRAPLRAALRRWKLAGGRVAVSWRQLRVAGTCSKLRNARLSLRGWASSASKLRTSALMNTRAQEHLRHALLSRVWLRVRLHRAGKLLQLTSEDAAYQRLSRLQAARFLCWSRAHRMHNQLRDCLQLARRRLQNPTRALKVATYAWREWATHRAMYHAKFVALDSATRSAMLNDFFGSLQMLQQALSLRETQLAEQQHALESNAFEMGLLRSQLDAQVNQHAAEISEAHEEAATAVATAKAQIVALISWREEHSKRLQQAQSALAALEEKEAHQRSLDAASRRAQRLAHAKTLKDAVEHEREVTKGAASAALEQLRVSMETQIAQHRAHAESSRLALQESLELQKTSFERELAAADQARQALIAETAAELKRIRAEAAAMQEAMRSALQVAEEWHQQEVLKVIDVAYFAENTVVEELRVQAEEAALAHSSQVALLQSKHQEEVKRYQAREEALEGQVTLAEETATALQHQLQSTSERNNAEAEATRSVRENELASALERAAEAEVGRMHATAEAEALRRELEAASEQPRRELEREKEVRRELECRVKEMQTELKSLQLSSKLREEANAELNRLRSLLEAQQAQGAADSEALDTQLRLNTELRAELHQMRLQLMGSSLPKTEYQMPRTMRSSAHADAKSPVQFPSFPSQPSPPPGRTRAPAMSERNADFREVNATAEGVDPYRVARGGDAWRGHSPIRPFPEAPGTPHRDVAAEQDSKKTRGAFRRTSPRRVDHRSPQGRALLLPSHMSSAEKAFQSHTMFVDESESHGRRSGENGHPGLTSDRSPVNETSGLGLMSLSSRAAGLYDSASLQSGSFSPSQNPHAQVLRNAASNAILGRLPPERSKPVLAFAEVNAPHLRATRYDY